MEMMVHTQVAELYGERERLAEQVVLQGPMQTWHALRGALEVPALALRGGDAVAALQLLQARDVAALELHRRKAEEVGRVAESTVYEACCYGAEALLSDSSRRSTCLVQCLDCAALATELIARDRGYPRDPGVGLVTVAYQNGLLRAVLAGADLANVTQAFREAFDIRFPTRDMKPA